MMSNTSSIQSTERVGQVAIRGEQQRHSTASIDSDSIHILDDNSLLNIFYLYRPAFLDGWENARVRTRVLGGWEWSYERWWYKLAHVCRRWRNLILGSPFHLGVYIVCTYGTPVAHVLAHSPPLPIVIDYFKADRDITAEEEGIILALGQRDRVRRIRLISPNLQKLIISVNEEYPLLEVLIMAFWSNRGTTLTLPETFQAPHLRHLLLQGFALPIGRQLLTTAVGPVTLCLYLTTHYFHPNTLLQCISFMPQLELLLISFVSPGSDDQRERQSTHAPIITHVALPNLRSFIFRGSGAYLEAVVCRITTPRLEKLSVRLSTPTFSVPHLRQFMNITETLRFDSAQFKFSGWVQVFFYSQEWANTIPLSIYIDSGHPAWRVSVPVSSIVPLFSSHSRISSMVEHLTLEHEVHRSHEHDKVEWRKLLGSFSNVKTLHVGDGLVKELSRSLQLDIIKLALELLPELQELTYSGSEDTGDEFTSFIDARQTTGCPVTALTPGPSSHVTPPPRSPALTEDHFFGVF